MFSNTQQFSNATKALFENQFASLSALSGNVVESVEKVVALNMAAAKASSEESTAAVKQLLTAKDPQPDLGIDAGDDGKGDRFRDQRERHHDAGKYIAAHIR